MKNETLSPFAQAALKLDTDFAGIERISDQIARLDIESDNGLEHGLRLLTQFAQYGEGVSSGVQVFAQAMNEARERSERAAAAVGERAEAMRLRHDRLAALQGEFDALGKRVQAVNGQLVDLKQSGEPRAQLSERLRALENELESFINDSARLKQDAEEANFRKLGRNAESLHGTLLTAKGRISTLYV